MLRVHSRARIAAAVSQPHWGGAYCPDDLCSRIEAGELKIANITALDRLLSALAKDGKENSSSEFLERLTAEWSLDHLYAARRGLWILFEASPLIRSLDRAIAAKGDKGGARYVWSKKKTRRFSVSPEELPNNWQVALADMRQGLPGVHANAPAPSLIETSERKLCELVLAARKAGVAEEMSCPAVVAYERSLVQREVPLSPVTIHSSMRQVRDFARYLGVEDELTAHLEHRVRLHESRSHGIIPQKEAKVEAMPSYAEIFGRAFDLLGQADQTRSPIKAQGLRNTAVAITLFCPFPLRVADTQLRFGHELLWDGEGYRFNVTVSKTRRLFTAPVLPVFGFFIDQLILQGSSRDYLEELREDCTRSGRLLFVTYQDRAPFDRYVSYLWKRELGTGNHAARTKLHNEFGRLGARGVELAMRACGHRSEKTAEHYRTLAYERLALERIHAEMAADINDQEWAQFFA